ncbi:MAG: cytochrome c oxidase subunit II [Aquificales bacterium]|nr:cytochrome c oxidase subunit II [Aquificales bacterium]
MGKAKHYIAVTVLIILSTLGIRGALFYLYRLPEAASAQAVPIDIMFNVHFWMISFLFSLIMVFMLYSVVIFRRKEGDNEPGSNVHGHTGLEIAWTVIPVIVVAIFGYWAITVLNALTAEKPNEMTIKVIGQQWSWQFEYPEQEGITSAALVMPVGQDILLDMEARDVLHSFWIPEFRVKQDLIPDTPTYLRITPTQEGDYKLRCAEICGFDHSKMIADVQVLSRAEFDAWVEERLDVPAYADMTAEKRGEIWYTEFGCAGCHNTTGDPNGAGPTWLGIYGREEELLDGTTITVDDAYISESIMEPNAKIVAGYADPSLMAAQEYETRIPDKEAEILASEGVEIDIIDDLIAFMKTLEE